MHRSKRHAEATGVVLLPLPRTRGRGLGVRGHLGELRYSRERPLTLTLSPEYRGEGTNTDAATFAFRQIKTSDPATDTAPPPQHANPECSQPRPDPRWSAPPDEPCHMPARSGPSHPSPAS